MPTPFDTSFSATDLIEASHVSQFASPINDLESGSAFYAADAGSTDAYAITLSPTPSSYTAGMLVHFKANTANTGAASLNVNGLGAKTIKKNASADLTTGDISAGQIVAAVYDGTNFQLVNASAAVSPSTLDGLSDVVAASPTPGAVLVTDGTNWVPSMTLVNALGADQPPASPAAPDDEFTGASLDTSGTRFSGATAWAWRNQGGATATLVNGHLLLNAPGSGSDNPRIIEQVLPSAPWRYQMKLVDVAMTDSDYAGGGFVLYNTSSGKVLQFAKIRSGGWKTSLLRYNSLTSYNATPVSVDASVARGFHAPLYLEIESDGTTLTFRTSDTGFEGTFLPFATEALSTFISSVDRIGILANSLNSQPTTTVIDWFRRVA